MALSPGARLGPYEVLGLLGVGGMGDVYRARDPRLGREVAIKVLPDEVGGPDRLRRFEQEARAVGALNHPNILAVHDIGTHDGRPYVVTELLEGETLREVLRGDALPYRKAIEYGLQIARGLAAAHEKAIVHRDVKPENLFVTNRALVKILDFGLAKVASPLTPSASSEDTTSVAPLTDPGTVMGTVGYMSPEQVRGQEVDPRSDIFSFGVVLYEMLSGGRPFRGETPADTLSAILKEEPPRLSATGQRIPPALERVVGRCLEKRPEERFGSGHGLEAVLESLLAPSRVAPLEVESERNPYPGLASFTEADAGSFFGREAEVEALWQKLQRLPLLGVFGPSGAGKSSFLRAGLVPSLPDGWACVVCHPGDRPFVALAQALATELSGEADAVRELLRFDEPDVAVSSTGRWRRGHDEALVVVDQFEELFTQNPPEVQGRFAELLGRLVAEAGVHVLLSMRDDFLIHCHAHEALAPIFTELTPLMTPTGPALRRALVQPALENGIHFEDDGLVEEMLSEVSQERGALPLLAFAISRLWERRDRDQALLTREAYAEIGGVGGALAQHAEATLGRIGTERQPLVREVFRNLVTSQGTRAARETEELLSVFEDREGAEAVLRELIDARLLTSFEIWGEERETAKHGVEIIHESLLSAWPRLVRWQAQETEGAVLRDQLRQAAQVWDERSRSDDLLWSGSAYREFQVWRERYPGGLTETEDSFARAMAAHTGRRRRRRRLAVAAGFVILAGVAAAIGVSRQQAVDAARRAEASKLLALAQLWLGEDPTEALAFTTASLELADSRQARVLTMKVLWAAPPALELVAGGGQVPAFSPDGTRLAAAGLSEAVRVWSEDGEAPRVLGGHEVSSRGPNWARWTADGLLVTGLSAGVGRRVHVWSFPGAKRLRTVDFDGPTWWQVGTEYLLGETAEEGAAPERDVWHLRRWLLPDGEPEEMGQVDFTALAASDSLFEPDGRGWLYAKGSTVHLRPLPAVDGTKDRVFSRHAAEVRLFSGHPAQLYARDSSGEVRLWSFPSEGPAQELVIPRPETAPQQLFPDAEGRWLRGSPHADNQVRLWDTTAWPGSRPLSLRRSGSWYLATSAFHPRGDWVVASTQTYSRLTFWPLRATHPMVVDGHAATSRPLAFSPDGRWLATSWAGGGLRLWPLPGSGAQEVRRFEVPERVNWRDLVFDPKGQFLFAVGGSDRAYIVPLDGSPPRKLRGSSGDSQLNAAAISPSGRLVATAFGYGQGEKTLRVWDLETDEVQIFDLPEPETAADDPGDRSAPRHGYEGGVRELHFADESTLYTGGHGGIRRWDLQTGAHELVVAKETSLMTYMKPVAGGSVLTLDVRLGNPGCRPAALHDLSTGASSPLPGFGDCISFEALYGTPTLAATGDMQGIVRVGRVAGGEPHLLVGHDGPVDHVAVSPDLRWVATSGEDKTLRLWPLPDLSQPPLHTLPHAELLAKLRSLTNLRVVRDAESPDGWSVELGPFPGWREVPSWFTPAGEGPTP